MGADASELHDELRAVARNMLGKLRDQGSPDAAAAWRQLAGAGWLGLDVPEAHGGAGATLAEVAVVLEEMGRAPVPTAYLGTAVLGTGLLALLEPGAGRDDLLSRAAAGEARLAVAMASEECGPARAEDFRLSGLRLEGGSPFVVDAPGADRLLVLAREPDGGRAVVALDPAAGGVRVEPRPLIDATRQVGSVSVSVDGEGDGVAVDEGAVWRFAGDPDAAVGALLDRAAVATACDAVGVSEAMLAATVAYAGARHQFGRPIGSFQAVKHACADMLIALSLSRELLAAAVAAVAAGEPDAWVAASMAKAHACGAAVEIAGKAMQLHGGIGYTWESGVHVYLKRAALDRALFGSPAAHRRRLASRY
jgi:alkylation response protein AidB-like acyl-CoA dehydrogenase